MILPRQPKILGGVFVLTIFGLGLILLLTGRGVPVRTEVRVAGEKLKLKEPLTVKFNVPVNRRELNPQITPNIEGSWHWEGGLPGGHLARTLVFTPETVWSPNESYQVTFQNLGPFLEPEPQDEIKLEIATLPLPTVIEASVADNAIDVLPQSELSLTLDQPLLDEVDFSFRLEPVVELSVEEDPTNRRYVLRPAAALLPGQSYKLIAEREVVHRSTASGTVTHRETAEKVFERLFTVKTPPHLTSVTPTGESVLPTASKITVTFSAAMDRAAVEAGIRLNPKPAGSWRWESDQVLVYELAETLPLDTRFEVTLPIGTPDQTGYASTQAVTAAFQTIGALKVVNSSPNQKSGISVTGPVRITFNQEPHEGSVIEHLRITPAHPVTTVKEGRSIVVTPSLPWGYNTKYTVSLVPGAIGEYNRPSKAETILTFTTEEKIVLIPVAWDRQDRALSCEAAALKMALSAKGVFVSEDDIMSYVGYDLTPRTGGGWGDPDQAFVGDIHGAQNTTGYGVHWAPIARAASVWRTARAVSGMSLQDAARELEAGNPIVIWGVTGRAYYDPWVTPSGKKVEAWKGEHARTLIGFRGSVENPTSFIINDPLSGRVTWSAAKLRSDWGKFSNSGVIVY